MDSVVINPELSRAKDRVDIKLQTCNKTIGVPTKLFSPDARQGGSLMSFSIASGRPDMPIHHYDLSSEFKHASNSNNFLPPALYTTQIGASHSLSNTWQRHDSCDYCELVPRYGGSSGRNNDKIKDLVYMSSYNSHLGILR